MDDLRVGVVGLGNMGSVHARNLADGRVVGMRLAAVCDCDNERLAWARQEYPGIPGYSAHTDMLDAGGLDALIVATPHYSHSEIAVAGFEHGLHVLCEKPAGVYTAQAKAMDAAARRAGKVFAMMFNQRTDPLFQKVRELVQSGALGKPIRLVWLVTNWYRTQAYYNSGGWRATWAGEGGGVLLNQAVHNLDLWQWIYGVPQTVTAFCGFGKYHSIEVEDDVTIYAGYEQGQTAVFITSTGDFPGTNRLEITGDRGKLVAENGRLTFWEVNADRSDFEQKDVTPVGEGMGHLGILQNFANAIRLGEPLISPGEEGLHSLSIINAAYLSAWENRTVTLPADEPSFRRHLQERIDNAKDVKPQQTARHEQGYQCRWDVRW